MQNNHYECHNVCGVMLQVSDSEEQGSNSGPRTTETFCHFFLRTKIASSEVIAKKSVNPG